MCGGPRKAPGVLASAPEATGWRAGTAARQPTTYFAAGWSTVQRACATLASGPSAASSAAWQHTRACRPRSLQVHPGENVGCGKDYTLYALMEGVVVFEKKSRQQLVNVVPFEDYVIPEVGGVRRGVKRRWRWWQSGCWAVRLYWQRGDGSPTLQAAGRWQRATGFAGRRRLLLWLHWKLSTAGGLAVLVALRPLTPWPHVRSAASARVRATWA